MNVKQIDQIFQDTAYIRMGGRPEELKCAEYLKEKCAEIGREAGVELNAKLVPFEVDLADIQEAKLYVDGKEIGCTGYMNSGSSTSETISVDLDRDRYYDCILGGPTAEESIRPKLKITFSAPKAGK